MGIAFWGRAAVVLAVFAGCGLPVAKLVTAHGLASGAPLPQVRLAGAMAGLFAGGAVASMVALMLAFSRRER